MKITLKPTGQVIEVSGEDSLMHTLQKNGVPIRTVCNGKAQCAECRVKIVSGEDFCFPPTKAELLQIGSSHHLDGRRLSCQVKFFGDVTVDITEQLKQPGATGAKKIRGAKGGRQAPSRAISGAYILEKPEK
jgi:2Fe-2S ferredoxin